MENTDFFPEMLNPRKNGAGNCSSSNAKECNSSCPFIASASAATAFAAASLQNGSDLRGQPHHSTPSPGTPPAQAIDAATVNCSGQTSEPDDQPEYWGPTFGEEGDAALAEPQSFSELAPAAEARMVWLRAHSIVC
jgi:hypothetical protein